jgi:hypothetical protein
MAHGSHKLQFEIVAVLGLVALFTHMHGFWIAGLLLALIDIPDFPGWLGRIARAVERIAGMKPDESPVEAPPGNAVASASAEHATKVPGQAQSRSAKDEELAHA